MSISNVGRMCASLMESLEAKAAERGVDPADIIVHEAAVVVRWCAAAEGEIETTIPETITFRADTTSSADTCELLTEAAGMAIREVTRRMA